MRRSGAGSGMGGAKVAWSGQGDCGVAGRVFDVEYILCSLRV